MSKEDSEKLPSTPESFSEYKKRVRTLEQLQERVCFRLNRLETIKNNPKYDAKTIEIVTSFEMKIINNLRKMITLRTWWWLKCVGVA